MQEAGFKSMSPHKITKVYADKGVSNERKSQEFRSAAESRQSMSVSAKSFKPGSTIKELLSDRLKRHGFER